jgi:hypothetical protein
MTSLVVPRTELSMEAHGGTFLHAGGAVHYE